jgi:two-component system cell cycle sensor histidine kinase/response regulator CckA
MKTASANGHACSQTRTILLAEDSGDFRDLLTYFLHEQGYRVCPAGCAAEALAIAASPEAIDLVIVDIRLRESRGTEVAETIRKRRPRLPVLFMSGDDRRRAAVQPGDAFLRKPFELTDFLGTVADLVGS